MKKKWNDYKSDCASSIASRRKAEELIQQGKVKVNGKIVKELGTKVTPQDKVEVNNIPLEKKNLFIFTI